VITPVYKFFFIKGGLARTLDAHENY